MDSSIEERIFLHLLDYEPDKNKRRTHYEISQRGIAKVVDGSRSRVSRILREMKKEGYAKEEKKYLDNQNNRKRKVYYLTERGKKKGKKISDKFKDKKVNVNIEDGKKKFKAAELIDEFDKINSLLDLLVKLNNKDILEITEETEKSDVSFIDRSNKLDMLHSIWEDVRDGNCFTVFIKGESGIGKTSLVNEFKNELETEEFDFITGKAYSETSALYLPLREAFENHSKDVNFTSPISELRDGTQIEIDDKDSIDAKKSSLCFELTNQIKELSHENSMIIFLDDLMWADKATLHLINYMTKNLSNNPVFILGAYRPELLDQDHVINDILNRLSNLSNFKELTLKPFGWEQTREIIDSLINPNKISSEFVDLIHEKTEGNPLYIKEFIELLKNEKKLPPYKTKYPTDEEKLKIPPDIGDLLERRINLNLSKQSQRIVSIGSIIGEEISFELLKKTTNLLEIDLLHSIDELLGKNIWGENNENNRYYFQHDLVREVIYNNISNIKKKRFHRLIAKNIEEIKKENVEEYYSDIAYHYEKATDESKAKEYNVKAGKEAEKVYAYDDAIDMYESALNLIDSGNNLDILEKLADVHKKMGALEDAKEHYEVILENSDVPLVRTRVRSKLGQIFITRGNYQKAIDITNEGLSRHDIEDCLKCDLLDVKGRVYSKKGKYDKAKKIFSKEQKIAERVESKKERARALYNQGTIKSDEGQMDEALKLIRKAVEINEEIEDKVGLSKSFNALGIIFEKKGNFEKATEYFKETLQIAEKIDNKITIIRTLNNLGNIFNIKGENDKALEYYQRSLENAKKIKDKPGKAKIHLNMGVVYGSISEFDKALDHFENTLEIGKELSDNPIIGKSYNNIGSIYNRKGDLEKALDFYERSLNKSRKVGNKNSNAESLINIGLIFNKRGEFNRALDYFDESLKLAEEVGNKRLKIFVLTGMGEAYIGMEQKDTAKEYIEKALSLSDKLDLINELTMSYRLNGKVHLKMQKLNLAEEYLNKGLEIVEQVENNIEKFKIFYELGKVFREQKKTEKSKKYLNQSYEQFKELGMEWWAKQCQNELEKIK